MWNILSSKSSYLENKEPPTALIFPAGSETHSEALASCSTETQLRREVRQIEARLQKGQKACHKVRSGRVAWVQLLSGYAEVNGETLSAGDGASFSAGRKIVINALDPVDIVIFDLAQED